MIFADTSFFVAGIDRRDTRHDAARELIGQVDRGRIVTTNQVRGETWTVVRRKLWHAKACDFLDSLTRSAAHIRVHLVDAELEREALDWLRAHDEREYSFVDATSFAFMRRNGITEALAFDGDFAAAGFIELRPLIRSRGTAEPLAP